jgi:predicted DNA-binding transcriptional regulator AlpA
MAEARAVWKSVRAKRKAVPIAEMARMVGLSRSRFYALVREGFFPKPVYELLAWRAVYIEAMQRVCIQVRREGRGNNGRTMRFR